MDRPYGDKMAEYFSEEESRLQVRSAALESHIAVTHMQHEGLGTGFTDPVPSQPALLLAVQFRPLLKHHLWVDGKDMRVQPYPAGALTMIDLESSPTANLASSFDCVQMYIARSVLDEISEAEDVARFGEIQLINGGEDAVLAHLGLIVARSIDPTGPATPLFLETMALSVHRHLVKKYFGRTEPRTVPGGLAGWQERRVKGSIGAGTAGTVITEPVRAFIQIERRDDSDSVDYEPAGFTSKDTSRPNKAATGGYRETLWVCGPKPSSSRIQEERGHDRKYLAKAFCQK